jgi:hypothetical protein
MRPSNSQYEKMRGINTENNHVSHDGMTVAMEENETKNHSITAKRQTIPCLKNYP